MGLTPAGGLVMIRRSGDLDPGVMLYLLQEKGLTPAEVNHLINHQAGLLGISGISEDMRDLLAHEDTAAGAALAAVLGGMNTFIFTGGWRLLRTLGLNPEVCHLNEGHAAFAILERVLDFMKSTGQPFEVALQVTSCRTGREVTCLPHRCRRRGPRAISPRASSLTFPASPCHWKYP